MKGKFRDKWQSSVSRIKMLSELENICRSHIHFANLRTARKFCSLPPLPCSDMQTDFL